MRNQNGYKIICEIIRPTFRRSIKKFTKSVSRKTHPIDTLFKMGRAGRLNKITKDRIMSKKWDKITKKKIQQSVQSGI